MQLRKDIWQCAIVPLPMRSIVERGGIEGLPLHWLPKPPGFAYRADPFGLWRDGRLHVFVEAFDYLVARGTIDALVFDAQLRLIEQRPVLAEPWHLSYPLVFEAEGETWMMPEAHQSGRLTFYRAHRFPWEWVAGHSIALDVPPVDATILRHDGRWWLLYASAARARDHCSALHAAFADRLDGPWTPHPANPLRIDRGAARPGGTPLSMDGRIVLPVQDCSRTYGGAIRLLSIARLDPGGVEATAGATIAAPAAAAPFRAGLHTLSGAGEVTLIDVKRLETSLRSLSARPRRDLRRILSGGAR